MANPVYIPITATGTFATYPEAANLTYAVELAAGTTGTYTLQYTLDDPNDATWTPVWLTDPTNGVAQTASAGGFYDFRIRGLRVVFSALGGTASARLAVLPGLSPR
jgi:hypothetical protein